jgi:hypothetical protein
MMKHSSVSASWKVSLLNLFWTAVVFSPGGAFSFLVMSPAIRQRHAFISSRKDYGRSVTLMASMEYQQPLYQIGNMDLSQEWLDLVSRDKVSATVQISNNEYDNGNGPAGTTVKYGVRMVEGKNGSHCQEYAFELGLQSGEISRNPQIQSINMTLARIQQSQEQSTSASRHNDKNPSMSGATFKKFGNFVAQLQLVRTLRPPPSPEFAEATTAIPPKYDAETDSFVTGPLRLELRPLVGRLEQLSSSNQKVLVTSWDVFHNVSPADPRGHFLLLPTLSDKERNWRAQTFTKDDCHDVVCIASAVEPPGSLLIGYNSVGAGASQNHIHCHAWPCPPIPLLGSTATNGWNAYPVSNVTSICDFCDVALDSEQVEVSFLDYPVFCVLLSATSNHTSLLSRALAVVMDALDTRPHNIAFLNRNQGHDDGGDGNENDAFIQCVDVYVFARSKERSNVLPTLKLGVSEMMGVFHAQSDEELEILASSIAQDGPNDAKRSQMEHALLDVTAQNEDELWHTMKEKLEALSMGLYR